MTVTKRVVLPSLVVSLLLALPAWAESPKPEALIEKMRAVVWPAQPSARKLTITVTAQQGDSTRWVAGQARKRSAGGGRMLTVVLSPEGVRGTAWLLQEGSPETVQWVWEPFIRRVRKLIPVEGHQAFLSSDFTYADLGMVDLHSSFKLLGEEQKNGVRAYKIEEVPRSNWYYSRIVDWVDASSSFPLERDFYDPSNTLWKVETFEQVTAVDGVPTVLKRRMEDRQAGGNTVIDTSEVRYGADVPDSLFDSSKLPQAIDWGWK
jgi:Outer membrane lipoprotein-sorting protein